MFKFIINGKTNTGKYYICPIFCKRKDYSYYRNEKDACPLHYINDDFTIHNKNCLMITVDKDITLEELEKKFNEHITINIKLRGNLK